MEPVTIYQNGVASWPDELQVSNTAFRVAGVAVTLATCWKLLASYQNWFVELILAGGSNL